MTPSDLVEPTLLERYQHQNPIKFLELLLKGFCPIIRDSVDVNENMSSPPTDAVRSDRRKRAAKSSRDDTKSSCYASKSCSAKTSANRAVTRGTTTENLNKPFEIAERPPSDVIGISKKMWEGLCSTSGFAHPTAKCSGFCVSILTDHAICFGDDMPPEGEDCSIGTSETSTVDLSPQSSPLGTQRQHSFMDMQDTYFDDGEDEDECTPMVECENHRSYRGTQVLVATVLALYITLATLRSMGPSSIHFALESKLNATPRRPAFAVNSR